MRREATRLTLSIDAGPDADEEELAELTRQLREDLDELDLGTVDLVKGGETPERAKAVDPVAWGTLLVGLAAPGGVLPMLVNALRSWLRRHEGRRVTVEIGGDRLEMTGISSEDQERLIDHFLSRHTEP